MATASTLYVRCLGSFSYRTGASWEIAPTFKRGREVLQYMTTHPYGNSADRLAEMFWPSLEPGDVRSRLHVAIAGARKALRELLPGIEPINLVGGAYTWNPAITIASDYHELIALYNLGTVDAARRGVDLYSGEYCSGDVADWMFPARALSACAYTSMLELLAEHAWATSDYTAALDYGFRLVTVDRGNENATRLVMRSFAQSGRPSKAIESYQALRQWLKLHLGVAPSAETETLRRSIGGA